MLESDIRVDGKLESREQHGSDNQIPDQQEYPEPIGEILPERRLLLHGARPLIRGQFLHTVDLFGGKLKLIFDDLSEADLLIDGCGQADADDRHQQKRQPPTGASPYVGKSLTWGNKCIY